MNGVEFEAEISRALRSLGLAPYGFDGSRGLDGSVTLPDGRRVAFEASRYNVSGTAQNVQPPGRIAKMVAEYPDYDIYIGVFGNGYGSEVWDDHRAIFIPTREVYAVFSIGDLKALIHDLCDGRK